MIGETSEQHIIMRAKKNKPRTKGETFVSEKAGFFCP